ncbi:MAG: hypothetical protein H0W83_06865 [Planctomycetes bacterium]|nr:hypothetical protein [Planctomycetota bacterium]
MDPDDVVEESIEGAGTTDVTLVSLNKPIWTYGLRNPHWLLPERDKRATSVAFVALSCPQSKAGVIPEDDRGRFCRAVALFLTESAFFLTSHNPVTIIPAVKGSGPSMRDAPFTDDEIWGLGAAGMRYVVTGMLEEDGLEGEVSFTLYDARAKTKMDRFAQKGQRYDFGRMVLDLSEKVCSAIGSSGSSNVPWYASPSPDLIDGYLGTLARSLTLYLAQKGVVPKDALAGEPNLLQWIADFAVATPGMHVPPVLLAASLSVDRSLATDTYKQFKAQSMALVARESDPASPLFRLAPLIYQLFGEDDLYAERCGTLLENGDTPLINWLEALEAGYK